MFSSLVIDGLIQVNNIGVPVTSHKATSKPTDTINISVETWARVGGPPTHPPSKLLPPGNLCLHVSLQERVGQGRVGLVYSIAVGDSNYSLPPLVLKVTARHHTENLASEAWFYEEMEYLQGVSIARFYGFFESEIDPNSEVLDWAESDQTYNEEMGDEEM